MGALASNTGSPPLLRGEGTRKGTTGGNKCAREAISFSTQLRKPAPESLFVDIPGTAITSPWIEYRWRKIDHPGALKITEGMTIQYKTAIPYLLRTFNCRMWNLSTADMQQVTYTAIPQLIHASFDASPHFMHIESGNQLGSFAKIIKFKGCTHIHFMHTENLLTQCFILPYIVSH